MDDKKDKKRKYSYCHCAKGENVGNSPDLKSLWSLSISSKDKKKKEMQSSHIISKLYTESLSGRCHTVGKKNVNCLISIGGK